MDIEALMRFQKLELKISLLQSEVAMLRARYEGHEHRTVVMADRSGPDTQEIKHGEKSSQ